MCLTKSAKTYIFARHFKTHDMNKAKYFPSVENIEKASEVLSEILEPTPFHMNADLSSRYKADVYLKREDLQMVSMNSHYLI